MTLVHLAQIPDHPALVALDWCRIDPQGISLEAELQAAPGQRDYLDGPGQVLGWQADDVGTGAAEQPALYNYRSRTVITPGGEFTGDSAPYIKVVITLNVGYSIGLAGSMCPEIPSSENRSRLARRGSGNSRRYSALR